MECKFSHVKKVCIEMEKIMKEFLTIFLIFGLINNAARADNLIDKFKEKIEKAAKPKNDSQNNESQNENSESQPSTIVVDKSGNYFEEAFAAAEKNLSGDKPVWEKLILTESIKIWEEIVSECSKSNNLESYNQWLDIFKKNLYYFFLVF